MIHAPGAGIEFDDHVGSSRSYVDVEQFVVTPCGDEVFPVHFFGVEAEVS
jgi:hypothetical protein